MPATAKATARPFRFDGYPLFEAQKVIKKYSKPALLALAKEWGIEVDKKIDKPMLRRVCLDACEAEFKKGVE